MKFLLLNAGLSTLALGLSIGDILNSVGPSQVVDGLLSNLLANNVNTNAQYNFREVCGGSGYLAADPGVINNPRPTYIEGNATLSCSVGSKSRLNYHYPQFGPAQCVKNAGLPQITQRMPSCDFEYFVYPDRTSSKVQVISRMNGRMGGTYYLAYYGTIVSGEFTGSTALSVIVDNPAARPQIQARCDADGATYFPATVYTLIYA